MPNPKVVAQVPKQIAGALFWIKLDKEGNTSMAYDKQSNQRKSNIPEPVLKFCCETVLSLLTDQSNGVMGFTEHNRQDLFVSGNNYLFRWYQSYRTGSNSQFQPAVWYDWAIFDLEEDGAIPCQILCFVYLSDLKVPYESVAGFVIDSPGTYAIVRWFEESPSTCAKNTFMKEAKLHNQLYLFLTDNIVCETVVVPNLTKYANLDRWLFLVPNRQPCWLEQFYLTIEFVNNKLYIELYGTNMSDWMMMMMMMMTITS